MAGSVTHELVVAGSAVAPGGAGRPQFDRWLSLLWPVAVLFHLAGNGGHLLPLDGIGGLQLVLVAASIHAIVRPRPASTMTVAVVFLLVFWWKLPVVGNHEVLLALVAMTIVISVSIAATSGRWWPTVAAPAVRLVLIVGYGFIALSKLNTGFFDVANSCAVIFGDDLLGRFGPNGAGPGIPALPIIGVTAAVELLIPPLLIARRTRSFGVAIALGFHFVLAIDPSSHVWDFSAALLPMFLLFGSTELRDGLDRSFDRVQRLASSELTLGLLIVAAAHGMVLIIDSRLAANSILRPWFGPWIIAYPLWLAVGGSILVLAVIAAKGQADNQKDRAWTKEEPRSAVWWIPAWPLLIVVGLAALNGFGPYLQYRSAAAFNMYSNLEIVDGRSNHLLVPWPVAPDGQPSVVGIVSAEDGSELGYYVENELALPVEALHRYLQAEPAQDPMITIGNGQPVPARSVGYGVDDPVGPLGSVLGVLKHKLTFRRAVDTTGNHRCLREWGPLG